MKKLFFVVMATLMLASCIKSPKEKAEALVIEQMKLTLYHPETYAPSETQVDSAFTPYGDPVFYEKTLKLFKLGVVIEKYNQKAKSEKSSMSIWSGPYQSSYERNEYQEAKEKYHEANSKKEQAIKEAQALNEELKKMFNEEKTFIGFKVIHTYRANNNAGQTVGGKAMFLLDKDMKKIVASYDMDSEEYKAVEYIWKMMNGENSMADEATLE
jgi:hypothetical protein